MRKYLILLTALLCVYNAAAYASDGMFCKTSSRNRGGAFDVTYKKDGDHYIEFIGTMRPRFKIVEEDSKQLILVLSFDATSGPPEGAHMIYVNKTSGQMQRAVLTTSGKGYTLKGKCSFVSL